MEKEKIIDIVKNAPDKSNKDLFDCREILYAEFLKTKELIIDLTRHLDAVQSDYEIVNKEIGKRVTN